MTVSRPVGGILSSAVAGARVAIHLSGLPGDCTRRCWAGSPSPAWPCSGWGLPSRPGHPGRWCALTAPFHPYLCRPVARTGPSAVCSLWHFPAGHPDWPLASTLPCGVPTFLDTTARAATTRPTHRRDQCASLTRAWRPGNSGRWLQVHAARQGSGPANAQTYDAVPTARVTLPNGDGNSSSSGSTPVRMIEWRRSVAPTDWMVWRSSGVENSGTHTW